MQIENETFKSRAFSFAKCAKAFSSICYCAYSPGAIWPYFSQHHSESVFLFSTTVTRFIIMKTVRRISQA